MELTLHVGLKKTATTSLQQVLHRAKAELAAQGLGVPCTPAEHQRLARRMRMLAIGPGRLAREALAPLVEDARALGTQRVLLSSEHLIALPGPEVERLRALLEEVWPEAKRIRVLVYVREPVGFATSMCQQGIKNGVHRLADFHANPWPFPVAEWLETYVRVFGRQDVTVRHFHPDHLVGGDILGDVLHVLGVDRDAISLQLPRLNQSLSLEGVLVGDALVSLRPGQDRDRKRRRDYRGPLTKIEGARFVLPLDVQERVIAGSAADMDWLKAEFGVDIRPLRVAEVPVSDLLQDTALQMARAILYSAET